jgi:hypothetical protein
MRTLGSMTDSENTVVTRSNRGQWENAVPEHPELSRSYSSKEEAIDAGRATADDLGWHHRVEDAAPTGVITDPQEDRP